MDEQDDVKIEVETPEGSGEETEIVEEEGRADAKVKKLRDELEACKKEKQEYLDGWQRSKADYVNALRRSADDVKAAKQNGAISAIETLLPAFDALERAKEHGELPPGFEAIVKQLETALASLGVTSVGEVGEKFDPSIHEALGQDETKDMKEDDTVTVVLEKGWKSKDMVIRPAKVRVAHFASN